MFFQYFEPFAGASRASNRSTRQHAKGVLYRLKLFHDVPSSGYFSQHRQKRNDCLHSFEWKKEGNTPGQQVSGVWHPGIAVVNE
jgi:hypothetical protein